MADHRINDHFANEIIMLRNLAGYACDNAKINLSAQVTVLVTPG